VASYVGFVTPLNFTEKILFVCPGLVGVPERTISGWHLSVKSLYTLILQSFPAETNLDPSTSQSRQYISGLSSFIVLSSLPDGTCHVLIYPLTVEDMSMLFANFGEECGLQRMLVIAVFSYEGWLSSYASFLVAVLYMEMFPLLDPEARY